MDLAGWLAYLETRNAAAPITMGLERVRVIAERMQLAPTFPLITVGGTNGKGSVCAYLEAMLQAAGYRAACHTSPHLLRYNERIRIDAQDVGDDDLCAAFAAVEAARAETPLTYFEQGALAAMWLFMRARVDVAILEVGLGGRLDAVNVWDADCAIVTSIDLDHQAYLGETREAIGFEKAGIYRPGRPAICGDANPPESLLQHAAAIGAQLICRPLGLSLSEQGATWSVHLQDVEFGAVKFTALPRPSMAGTHQLENAACALAALHVLRQQLPVPRQALRLGLVQARQRGRFEVVGHAPLRILDVAHNPHGARALAANLAAARLRAGPGAQFRAVLGVLSDKDVPGVIAPLRKVIDVWHVAPLPGPRGQTAQVLSAHLAEFGLSSVMHEDVAAAWLAACSEAGPADTICAFGSFYTVADVLPLLD